jgi:nitrogen fixation NifU-like protein
MESMYQEHILDLYERRPNFGKLKNKTHELKHKNPICNDEITLDLEVKEGKIVDARFYGISCFISTVSAAALTEKIKGMKISDIQRLNKEDMDKFLGINIIPTRIACELLPLEALKKLK